MKKYNLRKIKVLFFILAAGIVCSGVQIPITVRAGSINGNEASVISVARGTFEYEGKTYVAKQEYIQQMIAKFNQDDIDLTEAQASEAISAIYNRISEGINDGYLTLVGSSEKSDSDGDKPKDIAAKEEKTPKPKSRDSYQIPPVIKETGFSYFSLSTLLMISILVMAFLISIIMSIKICRLRICNEEAQKEEADE